MAVGQLREELITETDERRALRESVGKLVGRYGRKYFQDVVRREELPHELWAELGQAGYLGVHLPEEYGGGGGGLGDLAVDIEETAAQGCPIFMLVIRITTTAHRDGDGWRLSGQKQWTSGLDESDAMLVVARGPEAGPNGRHPLSLFIVRLPADGLTMQPIDVALQVPETQFNVFFDNVPVRADDIVGDEGEGLRQVFAGLNPERVAAGAQANGIGRYALRRAAQHASERTVWSAPIGSHQGIAHPLAKAYIDARLMTQHAADLSDAGVEAGEAATVAKYAAGEACIQALDQAIQTHGGNGLSHEYGLSDLWFAARMFRTAPVSREMVLNYVAQHSLGLPRSY